MQQRRSWPRVHCGCDCQDRRDEGLFEKAHELGDYWANAAHRLRGKRHVIDDCNIGPDCWHRTRTPPSAPTKRAIDLFHACFDNGLLVKATRGIIALSPPLILEKQHIDQMFEKIRALLERIGEVDRDAYRARPLRELTLPYSVAVHAPKRIIFATGAMSEPTSFQT